MEYIVDHIPHSSKRPGTRITPTYLTIHSTGNPKSTARNERSWLTNPSNGSSTSWHICVDDKEAVEAIPLDEIAHHAGTSTGNRESIGIEICESGDRSKTIMNAIELVANMLYERNWGIDKLKRHFDWSGKICPAIFHKDNWKMWEDFKEAVAFRLVELKAKEVKEMRYNTIDSLPDWALPTIQKMIDKGAFADTNRLDLSIDMIRTFVLLDRLEKI